MNKSCFKEKCVVCHENKKKTVKCNICNNTSVCGDCLLCMCEHGIADKCPVCRSKNWILKNKESKTSTKIIPGGIIIQREENTTGCTKYKLFCERRFKIILTKLIMFICMNIVQYMVGLFVILLLFGNSYDKKIEKHLLSWVSYIVGSILFHGCICCCAKKCGINNVRHV